MHSPRLARLLSYSHALCLIYSPYLLTYLLTYSYSYALYLLLTRHPLTRALCVAQVQAKALYDADHDVVAPHGLFGQVRSFV